MKVFFGAAIQGVLNRGERAESNRSLIDHIKYLGHEVLTEHTASTNYQQIVQELEKHWGKLPPDGMERRVFVRNKMIEAVESNIDAAIFEVSVPSLGTGVEFSHAYLRPRMGLTEIPILALYQDNYWPNNLSTMILGITQDVAKQFTLATYANKDEALEKIEIFLKKAAN